METKICTLIEQSKKLIELGINVKTADMFWSLNPEVLVASEYMTEDNCIPCVDAIPAWSLSALLELIPKFSLEKDVSNNEGYQLHYNYDTTYYDNLVDAAFEMICWLKEKNLL